MNAWESVRVAVVARSEVARGGLARMLADIGHVGQHAVFEPEDFTAAAPEDAIQLLVLSCDVLVLWCDNGAGTGEEAWVADLAAVTRRNGIRVVLMLPSAEVQRAAYGAGVPHDAVLDRDALTTGELGVALGRLSRGERLAPQAVPRKPPPTRGGRDAAPRSGSLIGVLTERERQVLELLVEGLSNRQIGHALSVSEHAAKRLVAIVLSKLNCPNRTQAVAVALREGLVGAWHPGSSGLRT